MKTDGLNNNLTGLKYLDFAVCWYDIGHVEMITRNRSVTLRSRVIFFEEYEGLQSFSALRLFIIRPGSGEVFKELFGRIIESLYHDLGLR